MKKVTLYTSMGNITLELDDVNTKQTTENFINYVRRGFYDQTIFHRVIDGFMIQGGGLTADMATKTTGDEIENEAKFGYKNDLGTIAMARRAHPHSASSQFFINVKNNDFLNFKAETDESWGYCAFGKVVDGMDVVMNISHVNTVNKNGYQDVPERDVILKKAELLTETSTVN